MFVWLRDGGSGVGGRAERRVGTITVLGTVRGQLCAVLETDNGPADRYGRLNEGK